jgi:hypothetical protein
MSYKYNFADREERPRSPHLPLSPEPLQAVEISELKLTISQLRNSLQVCSENSQRMQEELFLERSKNLELAEVRRRMEEELHRMEFELERIGDYESLETRESTIKLENALRENSKLATQVSDLIEELKSLKGEQRKLMSECDTLLKEKLVLMRENEALLGKLELLENEVREVKQEVAHHSQKSLQFLSDAHLPSRINNMQTVRTYQASTINNSPRMPLSRHSIELEELPEEVDYEEENEKLLEDYHKLLEENESMKLLYNNFYKNDSRGHNLPEDAPNRQDMRSFSNKRIVQQLNSSRNENEEKPEVMLKTMQRQELKQDIAEVRELAISELTKVYNKTVERSKAEHKNCLKMFIHGLLKNRHVYSQMAENYLEARVTIQEETGLKFPERIEQLVPKDEREKMILQMYRSVKEKAKSEKDVGTSLAIFRLLTLLVKGSAVSAGILENIKHSILKYVYKLSNRVDSPP